MIGWRSMSLQKAGIALFAATLLVAPLVGCAPEPGTPGSEEQIPKHEPDNNSWNEENPDEAYEKTTTLPDGFPAEFVIPEGAKIDDAGSRGDGSWFLVLRAADRNSADQLWSEVIEAGSFAESDTVETSEGGTQATLVSGALDVTALRLPENDGAELLSYEIAARVS